MRRCDRQSVVCVHGVTFNHIHEMRQKEADHIQLYDELKDCISSRTRPADNCAFAHQVSQQVVLYKNAREAITNAIRHGEAKRVQIILHYGEQDVRMEVSNDGTGPGAGWRRAAPNRQGIGMSGMLERTQVVGGRWRYGRIVLLLITRSPVYRKREIM